MLHVHKKKITIAGIGLTIFAAALVLSFGTSSRSSSITPTCSNPPNGPSLPTITQYSGVANLTLNWSNPVPREKIKIMARRDGESIAQRVPLGYALQTTSGSAIWTFLWDTSLWGVSSGAFISAEVKLSDGSYCVTPETQAMVANPTMGSLSVITTPPEASLQVGAPSLLLSAATVSHNPTATAFNATQYAYYEWANMTTIGSITPNGYRAGFSPGTVAGQSTIKVRAYYGGASAYTYVPISVTPTSTTTTAPTQTNTSTTNQTTTTAPTPLKTSTTTPPATTTNSTDATKTEEPTTATTTQVTSRTVQITDETKSCIEQQITAVRYEEIRSGTRRPTDTELVKIQGCFKTTNYILPTTFSPIDPTTTKDLPTTSLARVAKLENKVQKDNDVSKKTLVLSGVAKPNTIVYVYIYSDPLVVTTTSDGKGNWQYTLEDPLEPGTHEVYAVVNKGDGVYERSDPLSFFISTASASAANPNNLSLQLETPTATPAQSNSSFVWYIVGGVAVLVAISVGLLVVMRLRSKKKEVPANTTAPQPNTDTTLANEPQPSDTQVTTNDEHNLG